MREIPLNLPRDTVFDFEQMYEKIEALKSNYSDNPHIVQMVGEDHGFIIEAYFNSNPKERDFFWCKSPDLFEMVIQLQREISVVECSHCKWARKIELFIAVQFLKKVRFNNLPHLIYSATIDRPILPKNKITEFVQFELARHIRDKHNALHAGNRSSQNEQENSKTNIPEEHSTNHQSPSGQTENKI